MKMKPLILKHFFSIRYITVKKKLGLGNAEDSFVSKIHYFFSSFSQRDAVRNSKWQVPTIKMNSIKKWWESTPFIKITHISISRKIPTWNMTWQKESFQCTYITCLWMKKIPREPFYTSITTLNQRKRKKSAHKDVGWLVKKIFSTNF